MSMRALEVLRPKSPRNLALSLVVSALALLAYLALAGGVDAPVVLEAAEERLLALQLGQQRLPHEAPQARDALLDADLVDARHAIERGHPGRESAGDGAHLASIVCPRAPRPD